jgi:hypothetical protein
LYSNFRFIVLKSNYDKYYLNNLVIVKFILNSMIVIIIAIGDYRAIFECKICRRGMNVMEYESPEHQIQETVKILGLSDEAKRLQARRSLEALGRKAVQFLAEALKNGNRLARREAAEVLATIKDPSIAESLVAALEDEDHDVRWTAMKALIALDQDGLEPLLLALMRDFNYAHLREGARHILNTLKKVSCLESPFLDVLEALESIEPVATVPWAAESAWEELYGPRKKARSP